MVSNAPPQTRCLTYDGSTGKATIVTCEGDISQTTTSTQQFWGSLQTGWDCRAASGSEADTYHSDRTSVGAKTQAFQDEHSPNGSGPNNMGTRQVAGNSNTTTGHVNNTGHFRFLSTARAPSTPHMGND